MPTPWAYGKFKELLQEHVNEELFGSNSLTSHFIQDHTEELKSWRFLPRLQRAHWSLDAHKGLIDHVKRQLEILAREGEIQEVHVDETQHRVTLYYPTHIDELLQEVKA